MFFTFGVFGGDECSWELLGGKKPRFHGEVSPKSHEQMRKIKRSDTKIEILLRKELQSKGYSYRKNDKTLPGTPDIVLTQYKIAIFGDSEFFHGKDWEILKPRLEKGKNPDIEAWEAEET